MRTGREESGRHSPGTLVGHQKQEASGEVSPLEPMEEVHPCQRFDFRLLSSRSVREYIFVALCHQVYGNFYSSPRKQIQS